VKDSHSLFLLLHSKIHHGRQTPPQPFIRCQQLKGGFPSRTTIQFWFKEPSRYAAV
jgi:hypothetical protein